MKLFYAKVCYFPVKELENKFMHIFCLQVINLNKDFYTEQYLRNKPLMDYLVYFDVVAVPIRLSFDGKSIIVTCNHCQHNIDRVFLMY